MRWRELSATRILLPSLPRIVMRASVSRAVVYVVMALVFPFASAPAQAHEHDHATARDDHADLGHLGTVVFPTSASKSAQPLFTRGVALLHSFEYDDAISDFQLAEQRDPGFALAYWLEALANRQPLWKSENIAAAHRALARLGPSTTARLARAATARERAWGAAVEALFADTTEAVRATAFADSMVHISAAYPRDLEAQAFAALALMGEAEFTPRATSDPLLLRAGALAEGVFRASPSHPGAAHYMIHAYDDRNRAAKGLAAARAYARIAPSSEHALHMPAHIFVQLGLWDDMAASNEAAWKASLAHVRRRGWEATRNDFHAAHWLHYAYVQEGRLREARALDARIERMTLGVRPPVSDSSYEPDILYGRAMRALSVATLDGDWSHFPHVTPALAAANPDAAPPAPDFAGAYVVYLAALADAQQGDAGRAERVAREYRATGDTITRAAARFRTMAAQLDGVVLLAHGDTAAAITTLRRADDLQALMLTSGPPLLQSSSELLGQTLLAKRRPTEAMAAYQEALVRTPNRSEALLGLARSAHAAGDDATSRTAARHLMSNWHRADRDLPWLSEVRRLSR